MTKAEKSRVNLLEKLYKIYGGYGFSNLVLVLLAVSVVLFDTMLLFAAAEDDELYMIFPFHIFMATFFISAMTYASTSLVNSVNSIHGKNNTSMLVNGSMDSNAFLGTLPFQAKDLLRLNVKNYKKQLYVAIATSIAVIIVTMLAERKGYTMHFGMGGVSVISFMICEILIMLALFMKKAISKVITIIVAFGISIGTFMGFASFAEDHEKTAEFAEAIEGFGFLATIPGIIVLVIFGIAASIAADKLAEKKKNISWNL